MRTLCAIVLLLAVSTICAAFCFGVFTMTAEREEAAYKVSLVIHMDTVKAATESAQQKAKELTGTATVEGHVSKIEENGASFTVATADHRELIFHMDATATITGTALQGLHVGDRVTVNYKTNDGKNLARSVTVVPGI
jgi:hypothetical protein